jgi:hypothetical protein
MENWTRYMQDYDGLQRLTVSPSAANSSTFYSERRGEARLRFCSCSYSPAHEWTPKTLTTRPRSTWPTWKK